MSSNWYARAVAAATLAVSGGVSWAQAQAPRDAWLMQNYRFTGPPQPGSIPPVDPLVYDLRQILNVELSIMRKADFFEDYEATLAAAAQATNTAQLIGGITQHESPAIN